MIDRIDSWFSAQPIVTVLMVIAALALFGALLTGNKGQSDSFWMWCRRAVEAIVVTAMFVGILWVFRLVLSNNNVTFYSTHGSLSDASLRSAQSIWGRPHVQRDLAVTHSIQKVVQEEIPAKDPADPPRYKDVLVTVPVEQNSIIGFVGRIDMALNEREKGYALYNGFTANARFEYDVINDSDLTTDAQFDFPLSPGQTFFENFTIKMGEQDISPKLRFSGDLVHWKTVMSPHQRNKIAISYLSRGMEYLYYQIPSRREIKNFSLTVTIDRLPVSLLNYPDGVLSPTSIEPTADQNGSILKWEFDHAVTTAGMGVALVQPEQPGAKVYRVLVKSPYALTLLIALVCLTLIIVGEPVRFMDLALLGAAYCVQFLIMAAISDYALGFWGSLVVGAAVTGLLTYLLCRSYPSRLARILTLVLAAFFALAYPLSGLIDELNQANSFDSGVQVGLIVYLFALTLYARLRTRRPVEARAATQTTATAA